MDVSGDDVTSCLIGTWSADGKAVYYMALGSIWRRDIETGEATEIVKDGWQAIEQPEETSSIIPASLILKMATISTGAERSESGESRRTGLR